MNAYEVHVTAKAPRARGPTWTDEEVRKLFLVWGQPDICKGFQNEKRKREIFHQVSSELAKLNVTRSWQECKAKIKNLKGEYRKARDGNAPHTFKYFSLMQKVLEGDAEHEGKVTSTPTPGESTHDGQSAKIEFQIIPASAVDYQGGILHHSESFIVPATVAGTELEAVSVSHEEPGITQGPTEVRAVDAESGAQVIVIATSQPATVSQAVPAPGSSSSEGIAPGTSTSSKTTPSKYGSTGTGKRVKKPSGAEVSQKRRKLHSLSEKMAETVERLLTKATESLLEEFKASEERFFEWEEKRRLEEQQREEKLLQTFVDALKSKPSEEEIRNKEAAEQARETKERQRILNMIQASDDPSAVTFDLLATRLTNMLTDQQKVLEQSLFQWETKMQKKEMKHTENIFNMILSAVKTQSNDDVN